MTDTKNLTNGIRRLDAMSAKYDHEKFEDYARLVIKYLRAAKQRGLKHPFMNVCADYDIYLPEDAYESLETFLIKRGCLSRPPRRVCRWYLLELYAMDLGLIPEEPSFYEPLIQAIELGGDFHLHHGDLCFQEAGSIPLTRYCNYS